MNGKVFDAVSRIVLCGMAVVLLTALAIPELIKLGVEKEVAEEVLAPWLAGLVVVSFYIILYAWPRRVRKGTLTDAEQKMAAQESMKQTFVITVSATLAVAVAVIPALHLAEAPAWLHSALGAAVTVMALVAAIEWQLLKRARNSRGRR